MDYLRWQAFLRAETKKVLWAFYTLNAGVLLLVMALWAVEVFTSAGEHHPPIITERVVLALIAASSAQLGGLAFAASMAVIKRGAG